MEINAALPLVLPVALDCNSFLKTTALYLDSLMPEAQKLGLTYWLLIMIHLTTTQI